jgi:hemerythrin-like domain-containing protein
VARAIEILMGEHRLIERVLGSLETYVVEIERGLPPERRTLADYAAFFRGFADACHHGKEEDILFQRMLERGMPRQTGPLAVMFHEHVLGRARVAALRGLGEADGPLAPVEVQLAVENASGFIELLRAHILKEDGILYPMAERLLTGPELDALETDFEGFEKAMRGDGSLDRFHALADALGARFRPDPARMAEAASMLGCHAVQQGVPQFKT